VRSGILSLDTKVYVIIHDTDSLSVCRFHAPILVTEVRHHFLELPVSGCELEYK